MWKLTTCAFAAAFGILNAQTTGLGRITGTVTDTSGLPVPTAAVTVTNTGTGEKREASTNASGVYVVSPLPLGNYALEAKKEGFKTVARRQLRIDVNSTLTIDIAFEVGSVAESVTVSDRPVAIETENATIGNSRYEVQLKNLPVIVREIQTLVGQTAGVPAGSTDVVGGTFNQGGRSAMQITADGAQVNPFQTTGWPAIDGIDRRADLRLHPHRQPHHHRRHSVHLARHALQEHALPRRHQVPRAHPRPCPRTSLRRTSRHRRRRQRRRHRKPLRPPPVQLLRRL
jgi:hypothetical protein